MNKLKLTKYESDLVKSVENSKIKNVDNFEALKKELEEAAKNTMAKSKNVNIRMSEGDWYKLKIKAAKNGLPYQTLMATILHQYASGKIEITL